MTDTGRRCCVESAVVVYRVECADGAVVVTPACAEHEVEVGTRLWAMGGGAVSTVTPVNTGCHPSCLHFGRHSDEEHDHNVRMLTYGLAERGESTFVAPGFLPPSWLTAQYEEYTRAPLGESTIARMIANRPKPSRWQRAKRWPGARWDRFRWGTLPRWLGYERDW